MLGLKSPEEKDSRHGDGKVRKMSVSKSAKVAALAIGLVLFVTLVGVTERSAGIFGQSQLGATCHSPTPDPSVSVTITGIPASYLPANNYPLTISLSGGPTAGGGFDLSITAGALSTSDSNVQVQVTGMEATHTNPNARSWSVLWTAPAPGAGTVTFHVAGNAVNLNGFSTGDAWNVNTYTSAETVGNQRPTIALTAPTGAQDWTGGTPHLVTWTMNDDTTPALNLDVYLNYTSSAGSGSIAGPLTGATSRSWTLPFLDATDAKVNATVIDSAGLKGYSEALIPKIDSTAPTVTSADPTGTGVGLTVPVVIHFSESMDPTATQAALSLAPDPGAWAYSWTQTTVPDDTLTANHAQFASGTLYTATLSVGAKDSSDTGNAMAASHIWTFTTFSGTDTTPPTVTSILASPSPQETHSKVNVSALVQDNIGIGVVWLNVSAPGVGSTNSSMSFDPVSGDYYLNRTYDTIGLHSFVIWASDTNGNWASGSGTFTMRDTTPPAAPSGLAVQTSGAGALRLTWTANSEPDLAGYKVYRSPNAGGPYALISGASLVSTAAYLDENLEGGKTYYYTVTAVDATGNESPRSSEASGVVEAPTDGGSPIFWTPIVLLVVIVVIILVLIVIALLVKRRRGKASPGRQPEQETRPDDEQ